MTARRYLLWKRFPKTLMCVLYEENRKSMIHPCCFTFRYSLPLLQRLSGLSSSVGSKSSDARELRFFLFSSKWTFYLFQPLTQILISWSFKGRGNFYFGKEQKKPDSCLVPMSCSLLPTLIMTLPFCRWNICWFAGHRGGQRECEGGGDQIQNGGCSCCGKA